MKKVFLLFGIAAFSAASAQQNDVFDIQKHLQKKQLEKKKADELSKFVMPPVMPFNVSSPNAINNGLESGYLLSNGDKVIMLIQDKMPCIIPDMSIFRTMPNAGKDFLEMNKDLRKMPNAALHNKIIETR